MVIRLKTSPKVKVVVKVIVKWTKRYVYIYKNDADIPIRFNKITKKGTQGIIKQQLNVLRLIKGVIIRTYDVIVEYAAPKSIPFAKNVIFLYAKKFMGKTKIASKNSMSPEHQVQSKENTVITNKYSAFSTYFSYIYIYLIIQYSEDI